MAQSNRPIQAVVAALIAVVSIAVTSIPALAHTEYVVQPGDTLSVIARDHGVSTAELAEANGITNHHLIRVGQTLRVPEHEPEYYTVQAGDSLSEIAAAHGVSSKALADLNGITDPNRIRVGQKLQLPSGSVASPTSSVDQIKARYPNLPSTIVNNPDRLALVPVFERWAAHYGVSADLVMAVAYQESGWQTSVVSNKGAIGVGQLLPPTADWIGTDLIGIEGLDPYNADDNIRMSTRFLLWLIGYLGSEEAALAGYYQGPTSYKLRGIYPVTEVYIAAVQGARWRFQPA